MNQKQAFYHFLEQNTAVVSKVCRIYANNADEFQDYFQEVVLQLWRSYQSFRGEAKASTWVYRIALNVCLTQLKLKKRRPDHTALEAAPLHALAQQNYDATQDEQIRKMYAAIRQLKEIDRAIILLYLEARSYEEIAEVVGISMSNVGVRINRIKQQLNKLIHGRSASIVG
ncbi:sigma-70 family RNA polymerase sigma factor [Porifericola rhodea]|uniref:RNA polymerase sigma factor n=1 Tax=Porifericola rhodea TaxID=930972 RepID=UPI002666C6C9|nr:sigma-70 family RNA polymerase sigma factor [Porifericola rhodea]WKN32744.1 sigma-70 family RNA polymerase sigma factor [Porifericola rhodea]